MIADGDLFRAFSIQRDRREELATDAKVIEMLEKSPYKDQLLGAGLFLRILAVRALQLRNLIRPHIGDLITDGDQILRCTELMLRSPELAPERLDQIPALPLGARLVVNPWSNRLELLRSAGAPGSVRERHRSPSHPLRPYPKYADPPAAASRKDPLTPPELC